MGGWRRVGLAEFGGREFPTYLFQHIPFSGIRRIVWLFYRQKTMLALPPIGRKGPIVSMDPANGGIRRS